MSLPILNFIFVTACLSYTGIGVAARVAIAGERPIIGIRPRPPIPEQIADEVGSCGGSMGGFTLNNDQLTAIGNNQWIQQMQEATRPVNSRKKRNSAVEKQQISAIVDVMQQQGDFVINLTPSQEDTLRRCHPPPSRSPPRPSRVCEPVAINEEIRVVTTIWGDVYQIGFSNWNQLLFDERCSSQGPQGGCANRVYCMETERTQIVFGCPLFTLNGNNIYCGIVWGVEIRSCSAVNK